jgi:branched-subunit amino acid transport protein
MILFTIILMGAIVFLLRFSFFAVPHDWTMPKLVEHALPYVLPARAFWRSGRRRWCLPHDQA